MNIPIYDINYNNQTGYYNIVDSNGNRYGEYLTFDDADNALINGSFENVIEDATDNYFNNKYEEYVVCREYISHHQHYVMFSRGRLTEHVSYPQSSTLHFSGFNDTSIKIYHSKEEAVNVAKRFNEISRDKKLGRYTNWKALTKWW